MRDGCSPQDLPIQAAAEDALRIPQALGVTAQKDRFWGIFLSGAPCRGPLKASRLLSRQPRCQGWLQEGTRCRCSPAGFVAVLFLSLPRSKGELQPCLGLQSRLWIYCFQVFVCLLVK